jgi:hypothetical protein
MLQKIIKPKNCIFAFGIPTSRKDFYTDLRTQNKDFAKLVSGDQPEKEAWKKYKKSIIEVIREVEPVMKRTGVTVIHHLTLKDFKTILQERKADVVILFTHWKSELNRTCFTKQEYMDFLEEHPDFLEMVPHSSEVLEWLMENPGNLSSITGMKPPGQRNGRIPLVEFENQEVYANYDRIVFEHLYDLEVETYLDLLKNTSTGKVEFYDGLKDLYDITVQIPADYNRFIDLTVCMPEDLATALRKCRPHCHKKYKFDTPNGFKGVMARFALYFYMTLFIHLKRNDLTYLEAFEEVSFEFLESMKQGK